MARLRRVIGSKAILALLILLASIQVIPPITSAYAFRKALQPLYGLAFSKPAHGTDPCAGSKVETVSHLTTGQRLVVGSILRSLGCIDLTMRVLPEFTTVEDRAALLAYQWGLVAFEQEDAPGAAALWRQGQDIDRRLLAQARQTRDTDLAAAQRWYEAAIMAAASPQMQAETITAYTEGLRGRVSAEVFRTRLDYLASYFGVETAVGYRLRGQAALSAGSYEAAVRRFAQAIALGFADAETWYWLGDSAWKTADLSTAENAFRAALAAPIQVTGRRPWHLDRLAALLSSQGRLNEALPFQEEAVRLDDYYYYADNLAVLYAQLGQTAKAQAMCAQAAVSWSASKELRCQRP